jgi:hypothetical protein
MNFSRSAFRSICWLLVLTLTILASQSCSKKKKNNNQFPRFSPVAPAFQAPANPNPNNDPFYNPQNPVRNESRSYQGGRPQWSFEYSFYDSSNACSTGRHVITGGSRSAVRRALCQELLNEDYNNRCAEQYRRHTYQMYCRCQRNYHRHHYCYQYRRTHTSHGHGNFNSEQQEQNQSDVNIQRDTQAVANQGQQLSEHKNVATETKL